MVFLFIIYTYIKGTVLRFNGPIAPPVQLLVDHFVPICDTIKSTISATGIEKINAYGKSYSWAGDGSVDLTWKICEQPQ